MVFKKDPKKNQKELRASRMKIYSNIQMNIKSWYSPQVGGLLQPFSSKINGDLTRYNCIGSSSQGAKYLNLRLKIEMFTNVHIYPIIVGSKK